MLATVLFVSGAVTLAMGVALWDEPARLIRFAYQGQRLAAGLDRASIEIDGTRWVYAYSDDAPAGAATVVMLHGFTGSKENWYPLARRLRGRYRLLVPDLPGWGESGEKSGSVHGAGVDYGYRAQAQRVARFIQALAPAGAGERVLLGHSMGGGIAAVTAAGHPGQVDRVGLLAAAGVYFEANGFGERVLAGENPFAVGDEPSLEHYLGLLFEDDGARPWLPWPVDRIYIGERRASAGFEQSVLDRIGRSDEAFLPGASAAQIDQPTLLLWCRQDAVIDASAMEIYAREMPQAQAVLLDGCGHMSLMERSDRVAAAVNELIERGRPR
nr:alpha/beta fold hydrolase [Lysobacter chinensis]